MSVLTFIACRASPYRKEPRFELAETWFFSTKNKQQNIFKNIYEIAFKIMKYII